VPPWPTLIALTCVALAAHQGTRPPLQTSTEIPAVLDLQDAAAADWIPADSRDPGQVQALIAAWSRKVAPLRGRGSVRIVLPAGPGRVPLLLAASQALRGQDPEVALYLAFDPAGAPIWDETAWGALQGGALLPQDLGPDPAAWPGLLARAQAYLPGRPWTLWLPADPGPRLGQLLGDGARAVLPPGGPGAALAAQVPAGASEVEGGTGSLLLRNPATGEERRWRFSQGAWAPAELPKDRVAVLVAGQASYDVGALLAKVRAERLREALKVRTVEADLAVDLHVQAGQGPGSDLGFRFRYFQAAGEPEETLQKAVLFNGVKAKLHPGLQLPIVESRTSMAAPVALTLTERYRYEDGGEAGPGRRRIRFRPAEADPLLYTGTLLVEEASGRILEEQSERSGLPGMVKSERRTLSYGEAAPGIWRMLRAQTFERWVVADGVAQIQRTLAFSGFVLDGPAFAAHWQAARDSDGTMLRQTTDGLRYYNKQSDGTRRPEERPRSSGRAIGGVLLIDPTLPLPVVPLAGLAYYDFNAFDKGIQVSALTAILFNTARVVVPNVGAGFDLSAATALLLLPSSEQPVRDGHLVNAEAVGHRFGDLGLGLGHDLGAGFRFQAKGDFRYDRYGHPFKDQYWTDGFALPPSGWTRTLGGELSWLRHGFQLAGNYSLGQRPDGTYGAPGALEPVPDQGRFTRWGGHAGYDWQLDAGRWMHVEAGYSGGRGFDRFQSLDLGGTGGDVRVAGIRSNAVTADQLTYAKAAMVLPTGPHLRLTVGLDQAWLRSMDDQKIYQVTGLGVAGDLPGFWWFTTVRVDLGVGLLSTLPGVRSVNGFVALLRVF